MLVPAQINTKTEFLRLSATGVLGNSLRTWNDYPKFISEKFDGRITIRNRNRQSKFMVPTLYSRDIDTVLLKMIKQGADINTMYIQEVPHLDGCRDVKCQGCGRLMNAEIMRTERYISMIYGTHPNLSLRQDVLRNGKKLDGILAVDMIKRVGGIECYDCLQSIWDRFPDAIIEFTVFSSRVGVLNQHHVIWEVRTTY